MANGETFEAPEQKEVAIKFGKGLVGDPFTSKNERELVEVKNPNVDREDHTPWASALPPSKWMTIWDTWVRLNVS